MPSDLGALPTIPAILQPKPGEPQPPVIIQIESDTPPKQKYDKKNRTLTIENDDGSAIVLLDQDDPDKKKGGDDNDDWSRNLAEEIEPGEAARIVSDLMEAVDADDRERQDYLKTRAKGVEMLGFRLEEPRSDAGFSSAPLEGMSVIRHPILAEAVIRFQANAAAELYPPEGPVKVQDDSPPVPTGLQIPQTLDASGQPTSTTDDLATALEKDFNHYLTVTDKGYRADSVKMLFSVGFGGCAFKKVYYDAVRRRPVSRSVDAKDLIVSNEAVDLEDAGRVTHRVTMRRALMRRMQLSGAYRDVDLGQPSPDGNDVDKAIAIAQGFDPDHQRSEDKKYEVDEIYCELDLKGFEHKEKGEKTGLELPFKVSIERTSRTLLELRRNWRKDDDTFTPKRVFVKYGFVPALGFYDIGLLQILGNATRALTAAWREMLDAGMFSVFPGLLVSDAVGRQFSSQIRVPPGGAQVIKTNGQALANVVMPLPYKDPSLSTMQLIQHVEQMAQRIGGTAELPVGEGKADAPVGTTLALIEQATKVLAGVHVGLHASQAEEFQLLKELFLEDPESFWLHNRKPTRQWEIDQFIEALDNVHIIPHADPNMPTHLHRIMKAVAVKQLQAMNPQLYDAKAVDARILRMIGFTDPEELFAPPGSQQPPGDQPDPAKMAQVQLKAQQLQMEHASRQQEMQQQAQDKAKEDQVKAQLAAEESADREKDRQSREQLMAQRIAMEHLKLQAMNQQQEQKFALDQQTRQEERADNHQRGQQEMALEHQRRQQDMAFDQQDRTLERQHEQKKSEAEMQVDMHSRSLDRQDAAAQQDLDQQNREQDRQDALAQQKEESRHRDADRKTQLQLGKISAAKKPAAKKPKAK